MKAEEYSIFRALLVSLSPGMLLHPGEGDLLAALFSGKNGKSSIGRASMEVAGERLFRDAEGKIYLPSRYLLGALVNAGSAIELTAKVKLTDKHGSIVPGVIELLEPRLLLEDHDGSEVKWMPTKFPCWTRSRGHKNDLVVRPRIKRWMTSVTLRFSRRDIAEGKVRQLFEIAGRSHGLGDFRVGQNKRSRFGRFVVTRWAHVEDGLLKMEAA